MRRFNSAKAFIFVVVFVVTSLRRKITDLIFPRNLSFLGMYYASLLKDLGLTSQTTGIPWSMQDFVKMITHSQKRSKFQKYLL
jgi:hypothetical protein